MFNYRLYLAKFERKPMDYFADCLGKNYDSYSLADFLGHYDHKFIIGEINFEEILGELEKKEGIIGDSYEAVLLDYLRYIRSESNYFFAEKK